MLYLPDGTVPTKPDLIQSWSERRIAHGLPVGYTNFRMYGKINAYSNFAPIVVHELVHFTYPDPDALDDWGRDQFTTLHRFVVPDSGRVIGRDLAECPQFTRYRDSPPPEADWPRSVHSYLRRLRERCRAQVFVEKYLCDDDQYDMAYRYPLASRTRRE